jgi:hypothetical protein
MTTSPRIHTARIRRLAVAASCDPRTIRRRLQGLPIKGGDLVDRIDEVLRRDGIVVPAAGDAAHQESV